MKKMLLIVLAIILFPITLLILIWLAYYLKKVTTTKIEHDE